MEHWKRYPNILNIALPRRQAPTCPIPFRASAQATRLHLPLPQLIWVVPYGLLGMGLCSRDRHGVRGNAHHVAVR